MITRKQYVKIVYTKDMFDKRQKWLIDTILLFGFIPIYTSKTKIS